MVSKVVILLSPLLCKSDDLILKLHQKKKQLPYGGWLFIGRSKEESVPGMWNGISPILERFQNVLLYVIEERGWVKEGIICKYGMFDF